MLAQTIWKRVHGGSGSRPFRFVSDPPYPHDVQQQLPDVSKAKRILGFEATTGLDTTLDEVIPWIRREIESGCL